MGSLAESEGDTESVLSSVILSNGSLGDELEEFERKEDIADDLARFNAAVMVEC